MQYVITESPLRADEFLAALDAFGHEWRESAQPPVVRALSAHGVSVRVRGQQFWVHLLGSRNRTKPVCVGQVESLASGCRIRTRMRLSRFDQVVFMTFAIWLGVLAFITRPLGFIVCPLFFAIASILHQRDGADERKALAALVKRAAHVGSTPQ